jgi:flagellar hook-length control protein FliK
MMENGPLALREDHGMNVAPVAPTPTPARAADAPSPAASAFGGLLAMANGAAGAVATQAAQPTTAPTADAVPKPVAIAAPVADHLPTPSPRGEEPAAAPDQPLAPGDTQVPADAGIPVEPTPAASPAPAAPAPKPAAVADALVVLPRAWQTPPAAEAAIQKPSANEEDIGEGDSKAGTGGSKAKAAKTATASADAQQPQPVMMAAASTPATAPQPVASPVPREQAEASGAIDAAGGSGSGTSAAAAAPHDPAPNGPDNLPPLLASQTPPMAQPIRQMPVYTPSPASHTSPVVPAEPGRIGRDIGVEIARHVAAGKDELTIRLSPAEMGRVDVRLSFDGKGALHATVRADSPQALDMLRRDAGDLGRSLADAGIRTDSSTFSFDSRGSGTGQFAQQQQHGHSSGGDGRPRAPGTAFGDADDGDALAALPYRQLRASGRVDLMA